MLTAFRVLSSIYWLGAGTFVWWLWGRNWVASIVAAIVFFWAWMVWWSSD